MLIMTLKPPENFICPVIYLGMLNIANNIL